MRQSIPCILLLAAVALGAHGCARLPPFEADLGRQEVRGRTVRAPYASVTSYFGYIAPGATPHDHTGGRKVFHLYAWLPKAAPEVGVRVVSPVKSQVSPEPGVDFVDPQFVANKDTEVYFDPFVRVARCLAAIEVEDIIKPCPQWVDLGENDDAPELPAQPSGRRENAQVRIATSTADPLRALVRGVYRISISQAKVGDIHGSYVLQLGTPGLLPGVVLATSPQKLLEEVTGRAASRLATGGAGEKDGQKAHATAPGGG